MRNQTIYDPLETDMKKRSGSSPAQLQWALLSALGLGWTATPSFAIPLPDNSTVSSANTAFQITNTGSGKAGEFDINNSANASPALASSSNGTGFGLFSLMTG